MIESLSLSTVDDRTGEDDQEGDEDDEDDPYIITANDGLLTRGTVLENETVRFLWDGTINGLRVPDGEYTIRVKLNRGKRGDEIDTDLQREATVTLDATPPSISSIVADGTPITQGSFIKTSVSSITVKPDLGEGSPIDLRRNLSDIVLKSGLGATLAGSLSLTNNDTELTFTLDDPLDDPAENGAYTLEIHLTDKARNTGRSEIGFFFDNVAPSLTRVATSSGVVDPGSGVRHQLTYVEATLADNLTGGLDLFASTIRLMGPNGNVLGRQTRTSTNRIRWRLLSPLAATDGLQDGEYTIEIMGADKAGNQTETIQVPFLYDNVAPKLLSLSLAQDGDSLGPVGDTLYYNRPITGFVAEFDDPDGVGINFTTGRQNTHIVFGTPKATKGINALPGRSLPDANSNTLTFLLDTPISSRDGSQDGRYVLEVLATDTLGNTKTYNYQLIYDTQLPTLVSTVPAVNETVSSLSHVEVNLSDKTSGIDFIQSLFQLTRGGIEVPVNVTSNDTDTATLTLANPIALDGSDDGTYAIEVTPTDRAGNTGVTVTREFYLVSQRHQPEIRLTVPETTRVNDLTTVVVELVDYIGAGIDFDASTLTVRNPQGALVPQEALERDEIANLLTWNTASIMARDGSADGEYTIIATFVDFTDVMLTQEFSVILDTQVPALVSTVPAANETVSSLSQIEVKLSEGNQWY